MEAAATASPPSVPSRVPPAARGGVLVAAVVAAVLAALLAHPFLFDKKGHYFYAIFNDLDPRVFAGDGDVESLRRFKSAYHEGLGLALRAAGVAPENVESIVRGLYVVSRFALVLLLVLFIRAWTDNAWTLLLVLLWSIHPRAAPLGATTDVSWFMPVLTHLEVAALLCLGALVCWLRLERPLLGWAVLSLSVFVHPLVTAHLAVACGPFLVLATPRRRDHLAGGMLFGTASVAAVMLLAPPAMGEMERAVFIRELLNDQHVAPGFYSFTSWASAVGTAALAVLAARRFVPPPASSFLAASIVTAFAAAIVLSLASVLVQWVLLMQLQPLRLFLWVQLFSFCALAIAIPRAFATDRQAAVALVAVMAFWFLNSPWIVLSAWLALAVVATSPTGRGIASVRTLALAAVGLVSLAFLGFRLWTLSSEIPLPSMPEIVAAMSLGVLAVVVKNSMASRLLMSAVLVWSVVWVRPDVSLDRPNDHWLDVQHWANRTTPLSARFMTPPDADRFRLWSLRTSVNEPIRALVWVHPQQYLDNAARARRAQAAYAVSPDDHQRLLSMAADLGADYVVLHDFWDSSRLQPLFRSGRYAVIAARSEQSIVERRDP